jgi:hypothetical protein
MSSAVIYNNPIYTDALHQNAVETEKSTNYLPYWQSKTLSEVKINDIPPVRVQMRKPTREIAKCAQRFGLSNIPLDDSIFCLPKTDKQPGSTSSPACSTNKRKAPLSPHVKGRESSPQKQVSTFPSNDYQHLNDSTQHLQRRFVSPTKPIPQKLSPFHCARKAKLRANTFEAKQQEDTIGVEKQYNSGEVSAPTVLYRSVRMNAANRAMRQRLRLSDMFDDLQRKQDEKHPTAIHARASNEINRRQSMVDTENLPERKHVNRRRPVSMLVPSTNAAELVAPLVQIKEVMDDDDENKCATETDEEFSLKMANATRRIMNAQLKQREVNRAKRRSLINFPTDNKTSTASFLGLLFGKRKSDDKKRISTSISSPILIPSAGESQIRSTCSTSQVR